MPGLQIRKHAMISGVSFSQDHQLGTIVRAFCSGRCEPRIGRLGDQVDSLLFHQARHDSQERHSGFLRQSKAALQSHLADRLLFGHVGHVIIGRQVRIGGWVPHGVVHAIDDPGEPIPALGQHALQATTIVGRLNLSRISGTDRRNRVRENDAGFQEIHLPVEFELLIVEQPPVQSRQWHVPVPEQTLISKIVNR